MQNSVIQKILWPARISLALAAMFIATASTPSARASGTVGVYVNSEYYAPTTDAQNKARSSGYSSLFLFALNVEASGNITGFGAALCQNGSYTGDPTWRAKLDACKAAPSSVNRIELVVGNAGSPAFTNIKNLIAAQGTGTGSILYRNFLALRDGSGVGAIQFDDESTFDVNSMVAFGNMLASMGIKVTFCVYNQQAFWVNVKNQLGNKVDAIYLQCYDGGAGNDPGNWNNAFGGFKVTPGVWGNKETIQSAAAKMQNWRNSYGIPGGFMWLNGSMQFDYQKWPPGFDFAFENAAVYTVGSYGTSGTALQGTSDLYLGGGGYVSGCDEVAVTPANGNSQQYWSFIPIGGGQWWIMNTYSGQLLQSTGDPYHAHGGGNAANCNKVALTPNSWNLPQQAWQIVTTPSDDGAFAFSNPANNQYLQSTWDSYWSNGSQYYVPGCAQVACTPCSWGVMDQDRWNLIFVRY